MKISIKSIHFDASTQLEAFIQKKVSKLEQFYDGILSAEVVLKVVKPETSQNKEVGIKILVPKFEETDECVSALEKQLIKIKEKSKAK